MVKKAGTYAVSLSNNGLDYSLASSSISLTYLNDFTVTSISNHLFHIEKDNSVYITVKGTGLPSITSNFDVYCVYLSSDQNPDIKRVDIKATPISEDDSEVECRNIPTDFYISKDSFRNPFNLSMFLSFDK